MIPDSINQPIREEWNAIDFLKILEQAHFQCIDTNNNSSLFITWSGGLDSTTSLCMILNMFYHLHLTIHVFTIGGSEDHPDLVAAKAMAKQIGIKNHHVIIPTSEEIEESRAELIANNQTASDGDIGVFIVYKHMAAMGAKIVIAHDGIDEQLGGYWDHRKSDDPEEKRTAFEYHWKRLRHVHLEPLVWKAKRLGIEIVFPYLMPEVVDYTKRISFNMRTDRNESKKPLREVARRISVPELAITRPKKGFCNAIDK